MGHKAVPYNCGFGTPSSSLQLWGWDTKQFLTVVGLGHQAALYICTACSPVLFSFAGSNLFVSRPPELLVSLSPTYTTLRPRWRVRGSGCVHFSNFVLSTRTRKQCCVQLANLKTCFVDTTGCEVARGGDQETDGDAFVCRSGTPGCCLVRPQGCAMLTGDTPSVRSHCQQPCVLICVLACNNDTAVTAPS